MAVTKALLTTGVAYLRSILGALPVTQGVSFPATQNPSSDANVLDDYEEGTWTPTDTSGAALVLAVATGRYVKVGQLVLATFNVTYPATADGTAAQLGGLPFATLNVAGLQQGVTIAYTDAGLGALMLFAQANATDIQLWKIDATQVTNANMSGKVIRGTFTYRANA